MKICITLDDVIRAKTKAFGQTYQKYINREIDLSALDLSSGDLKKIFEFKNDNAYNKFLYEDYAFDIFGKAETTEKMVDKDLNLWMLKLQDNDDLEDEEIEVMLSNPREFNISIGYTYFFLSKIATRIRKVFFPADSSEIWNECDVLITADRKLLETKPEGKKSIKIITDYNNDIQSDFEYDTLKELLSDNEFFEKIR